MTEKLAGIAAFNHHTDTMLNLVKAVVGDDEHDQLDEVMRLLIRQYHLLDDTARDLDRSVSALIAYAMHTAPGETLVTAMRERQRLVDRGSAVSLLWNALVEFGGHEVVVPSVSDAAAGEVIQACIESVKEDVQQMWEEQWDKEKEA